MANSTYFVGFSVLTRSIAAAPFFSKSSANAFKKALDSVLRALTGFPPGLPDFPGLNDVSLLAMALNLRVHKSSRYENWRKQNYTDRQRDN